jgi:hypothetical protein
VNVGIESYGGVIPVKDEFPKNPVRVHTIDLPFLNALGRFHMKTPLPSGAEVYPARSVTLAEAEFDLTRMKEGVDHELLRWM